MAGITVEVNGIDTVIGELQIYQTRVRDEIVALITRTLFAIERDAKLAAPVDTGRLRASIRADVTAVLQDLAGIVFSDVSYASYIEFGTTRLAAYPFLFPAYERHAGEYVAGLRSILTLS